MMHKISSFSVRIAVLLGLCVTLVLGLSPDLMTTTTNQTKKKTTSGTKSSATKTSSTSSKKSTTRKKPSSSNIQRQYVTPVLPDLSALTCDLHFDKVAAKGPGLTTASAILVNASSGDVLYSKRSKERRPIASLSKLVTAMVVLDAGVPLTNIQTISREDAFQSSRSRLRAGTRMTLADLLRVSLMISDNRATRALARAVAGTIDSFAVLMNQKVASLGLTETQFVEPTGLSPLNMSTAEDVARIVVNAAKYQTISRITATRLAQVKILNTKRPTAMQIGNTNDLIHSPMRVLTGKTGYISSASYCLATIVQNGKGERLTLVVLGAPGDKTRFRDARKLAEWGFARV